MVKNRLLTNSLRTIKKSVLRFLSLLVMSFLGSFVFAGLQATAPDMLVSLDNYLDAQNIYDIRVTSYIGFSDEAISKLSKVNNVESFELGAKKSYELILEDTTYVVELNAKLDTINQASFSAELSKGEIALEQSFFDKTGLKIGDYVSVGGYRLKIAAVAESSLYYNNVSLQNTRGNTNLGSGSINYYAFVDKSFFDILTDAYITVSGAKDLRCYDSAYTDKIDSVMEDINDFAITEATAYYNEKVDEMKAVFPSITDEMIETFLPKLAKTWTVMDRNGYLTYQEYIDDSNSIKNLSMVFPIVFYAVAVLISLISMVKMVEDDRGEIGTLKSLGFSSKQIISKYLIYAVIATLVGGILGAFLGLYLIPLMINNIYKILFAVPEFVIGINPLSTILSIVISLACVVLSTLYASIKVLREKPAELLRPKSPKPGKKILMERWKGMWRHISFSWKVTIRNIARFKKRAIITIVGLAGCTALMLCGFGVKDSIKDIAGYQFNKVFKYDGVAYLSSDNTEAFCRSEITKYSKVSSITANTEDNTSVYVLVFEDTDALSEFMTLTDDATSTVLTASDEDIYISEKTAKNFKMNVGDTLKLSTDEDLYEFKISYLIENYVNNYIILTKNKFESLGHNFEANMVYFRTIDLTEAEEESLSSELIADNSVLYVSFNTKLIKSVDNMMSSLNNVVIILIVLSCLLSFVVLFNLNNINIHERKREISTLKVLGFYTKEVDAYITRENIINTVIGIAIGLVLGIFLTNIVDKTVEIERARFIYKISPTSFIYTALLSLLFTFIVNVCDHFALKKIDMIESLKSVE